MHINIQTFIHLYIHMHTKTQNIKTNILTNERIQSHTYSCKQKNAKTHTEIRVYMRTGAQMHLNSQAYIEVQMHAIWYKNATHEYVNMHMQIPGIPCKRKYFKNS